MPEPNEIRRRQKREWYHRNKDRLKLQRDLGISAEEADKLNGGSRQQPSRSCPRVSGTPVSARAGFNPANGADMINMASTLNKIADEIMTAPAAKLDDYRPKAPSEIVERTGALINDSVMAMAVRIAEQVRADAQQMVDRALQAQAEATQLSAQISSLCETHAKGFLKVSEEAKAFLEMLQQQKLKFTQDKDANP